MPLAGTPREQKHYREIREKYPEKGKEYAARVARNIVRGNTPGGRKLEGTTHFGREWGPPYSKPLSNAGAETKHEKKGAVDNSGTIATPLLGAIPGIGPLTAGLGAGLTSPEGQGWQRGSGAFTGASLGAAGGMGLGYGASRLLDLDPSTRHLLMTLGGMGGSSLGAALGREASLRSVERARHRDKREAKEEHKKESAMNETFATYGKIAALQKLGFGNIGPTLAAIGGPGLGNILAAAAAPRGHRASVFGRSVGGGLLGTLGGGLVGAIADAALHTNGLLALLGSGGGGMYGAYRGAKSGLPWYSK
jgi:hypothetical protein